MYPEHGKNIISVEGDIIISKIIGAFNIEGVEKSISDMKATVNSFRQKEFKLLVDYIDTEGGSPEVYEKIDECNIWLNDQSMVAKAIVTESIVAFNILQRRTPARSSLNEKVFSDRESAMIWLKSQ